MFQHPTLILFVASSGSADDDWSETIPSSDSWCDSCKSASASSDKSETAEFDKASFDELSVDEASFVVVDHDDPSEETPELEGDTDPSTKTFAPTSTMEFGGTSSDVSRSPEICN